MKTRIILSILLATVFFTGCKNDKSVDSLEVVKPEEVVDNNFKASITFIAQKDDDFALYYTVDGSINFFGTKPVWQGFKGSNNEQTLSFIVPDEIIPTQIRFDFGMKLDQPDVILKSFKIEYRGKVFQASGPQVFNYFMADVNQCTADISTGTIKANIKDGKRLTPSIYPGGDLLGKEISKLTK